MRLRLPKPQFGSIGYARWEWAIMRTAFAVLCVYRSSPHQFKSSTWPPERYGWDISELPVPNGIAQFADLSFAASPVFDTAAAAIFYVALLGYVFGRLPLLSTLALLLTNILYGTSANSQGAIHHTGQIVGLVLLGQVLAHTYRLVRHVAGKESLYQSAGHHHRDLIYHSQQLVAAAYVITGISKLVRSGGEWVSTLPNIALQFEKNAAMRYYDTLVETASPANRVAIDFVIAYPKLAQLFFGTGLFLELFTVLALWNRTTLVLWAVSEIMLLGFAFNKSVLLIFFMNLPFWVFRIVGKRG